MTLGLGQAKRYWNRESVASQVPREGAKAARLDMDFSTGGPFTFNHTLTQRFGQLGPIVTLYIDNSGNTVRLDIDVAVVGQALAVKAGGQAYLPILAAQLADLTFTSSGGGQAHVDIINVPLPAVVWSAAGGGGGSIIELETGGGFGIELETGSGRIALE